jgi:hypothetical protein
MLFTEATWKISENFHVESAMPVFDDLVFGEEYYIPFIAHSYILID